MKYNRTEEKIMSKPLTEKDLHDAQCYDFSIQTLQGGMDVLIMVCNEKKAAGKLLDIFKSNSFDLKTAIDEVTGIYSLVFEFIDTDLAFKYDTGKSEENYPPLRKLKENSIKFITTGVWGTMSSKGKLCEYDPRLMRLGKFDTGDSFAQASGVLFFAGREENEPSMVMLTYNDYNHIIGVEAHEAYNRLERLSKGRPLLEINPVSADKINLKIWDILIDLDIQIDGLTYADEQLKRFMEKTGPEDSFAFTIGFSRPGEDRPIIASTRREGFEIITLTGYSYKNK
jgi:hypothetical protein